MENKKSELQKMGEKLKNSPLFKLFTIGVLILILMIPKSIINGLIYERKNLQYKAINEINSKWGSSQEIAGLILTIPYYTESKRDTLGKLIESKTGYVHFTPKEVKIEGSVESKIRYRSIYESILYQSNMNFTGNFKTPDLSVFKTQDENVLWDEAFVSIGLSDLKGLKENIQIDWNNNIKQFKPESRNFLPSKNSLSVPVEVKKGILNKFKFNLKLNGSQNLSFVPLAQNTKVKIESNWKSPSFFGDLLPDNREIKDSGFVANWQVLEVNRNIPEHWVNQQIEWNNSAFGVRFFNPINHYQKNERSIKYALLTVLLTFLVYFIFEFLNKKRIHIIRYFMVGISLIFFYSLLLSLSEHLGFNISYLISSIAITASIVIYSHPILKSFKASSILATVVAGLFTFIFTLLQLEEYALLVGNIGLFFILLTVMLLSRKWNWNN